MKAPRLVIVLLIVLAVAGRRMAHYGWVRPSEYCLNSLDRQYANDDGKLIPGYQFLRSCDNCWLDSPLKLLSCDCKDRGGTPRQAVVTYQAAHEC